MANGFNLKVGSYVVLAQQHRLIDRWDHLMRVVEVDDRSMP